MIIKKGCNTIFHNGKKGLLSCTHRCNEEHLCKDCAGENTECTTKTEITNKEKD